MRFVRRLRVTKTMASDALHLKDYRFTSDDELFLDANVWLLIHGPQKPGRHARTDNYSTAFRRMLEAGSRIYIDVVVLSEIINRWARFHYQESDCAPIMSFKQFRNSDAFKLVAPDIAADTRRILMQCSRMESCFTALDMEALTAEYGNGGIDFKDQVIGEACKRNGLKLVTDDGDFAGQGVPILTANRRLLN